eukprot:GHVU01005289.1.p2 GENE.GHVU01005289.1~~GHVU01005289.1.p2  ORF type:complete len:102 (-),score=4.10 GHVU01005289.1:49-354(-)
MRAGAAPTGRHGCFCVYGSLDAPYVRTSVPQDSDEGATPVPLHNVHPTDGHQKSGGPGHAAHLNDREDYPRGVGLEKPTTDLPRLLRSRATLSAGFLFYAR